MATVIPTYAHTHTHAERKWIDRYRKGLSQAHERQKRLCKVLNETFPAVVRHWVTCQLIDFFSKSLFESKQQNSWMNWNFNNIGTRNIAAHSSPMSHIFNSASISKCSSVSVSYIYPDSILAFRYSFLLTDKKFLNTFQGVLGPFLVQFFESRFSICYSHREKIKLHSRFSKIISIYLSLLLHRCIKLDFYFIYTQFRIHIIHYIM